MAAMTSQATHIYTVSVNWITIFVISIDILILKTKFQGLQKDKRGNKR